VVARAAVLDRAAELLETRMEDLLGLIMREAGKSLPNAIAEVREAVDFLRYYAAEARGKIADQAPLGVVTCISPWNFPLAIFTGQVAAALAAGNTVLAKPAEETPLIAAQAIAILHEAGIPADALQLVCGDGNVGAALVSAPETQGVLFTGSTDVARLIQRELAKRLTAQGKPIPFVAETGGQNAMIVDSSALAEQVVADVLASAFDSAGQRCSALRVLCLQDEIADRTLTMLKGALAELAVGRTDRLAVDMGPVITAEARDGIEAHVAAMEAKGCRVTRLPLPDECKRGTFVAATIIEIDDVAQLEREVFGPVLHVVRFARSRLDPLIDAINATGYGLTFGLHTRLDETIAHVTARVRAGNIYVNRNVIGAVVGVQPFGGRGLSGTGPKAGGPLYLGRLVQAPLTAADDCAPGREIELPGPVGERNLYALHPRGDVLLLPRSAQGLAAQLATVAATGNRAVICAPHLPASAVPADAVSIADPTEAGPYAGALIEGQGADLRRELGRIAALPGPIVLAQAGEPRRDWLVEEVSTSINTTAAGGNASLMALV
jgi:RHH-type proline utilization regulon transcriptional repressor/proline dehydrogenase/delta 1-pyrroline-5-carboxylate dehydrogenase